MSGIVTFVKGDAMPTGVMKTLPKNVTLFLPAIGLAQDTVVSDELFEAVKSSLESYDKAFCIVKVAGIPCLVVPPGSDYLDFVDANRLEAWTCSGKHLNEWHVTGSGALSQIIEEAEPDRHVIFGPGADLIHAMTSIQSRTNVPLPIHLYQMRYKRSPLKVMPGAEGEANPEDEVKSDA